MEITEAPQRTVTPGLPRATHAILRPAMLAVEWTLLLACAVYCGARALPRAWGSINTDFPNYYVTARLLREGSAIDRVYEWTWFQRQKDRFGIDQPVVGFIPHTPFSALVMVPFAGLPALPAKHAWILFNLLLLAIALALIRSLGDLPWRRILLLTLLCFPVYRNFEYGQYYILLLVLITLSLWLYVRGYLFAAGIAVAMAAGLKIFPLFFLFYFLRKKKWYAVTGLVCGLLLVSALSVLIFGFRLHQTFLIEVLPSALRGEAMDPYNVSANSISSLLHHLFIFEAQLNSHPLFRLPIIVAILQPLAQVAVLALAVMSISSRVRTSNATASSGAP